MHFTKLVTKTLAGAALLWAGTAAQAGGADTYLALGDSYAWGFTTVADAFNPAVSSYYGLQGYVPAVGAALGAQQIVNLAIPGETTASFTAGGAVYEDANFNYGPAFTDSQAAALGKFVQAETLGGHTISDITIQLGGNDLLGSVFSDPTFLTRSVAEKEAFVNTQLKLLGDNYAGILSAIHATPALAQTQVYVIGYFDPFADLGAKDPFGVDGQGSPLSGDLVQALNGTLQAEAAPFGFKFVDPYAAFRNYPGSHDDLSYIQSPSNPFDPASTPNFHPKAAGYALYAQQIEAAGAVPESTTTVSLGLLLALGAGGRVAVKRRKKRGSV